MSDDRPNILLIMADDMGYSDLGCYGGEIETPNLDRLAAGGVRFTDFYNNPMCMPTRASLLTGLYPRQASEADASVTLRNDANVTLAEVLREAGYRTLMVGKWHNGDRPHELPVNRGFDRYWGLLSGCSNYFNPGLKRPGEPEPAHKSPNNTRPWGDDGTVIHPFTPDDPDFYTTDAFTDHALQFLDQYGGDDRPFFLYLAHCAPHFPMQAWPEDIEKYRGRYRAGWEAIRAQRYQRLLELGLVAPRWGLSAADERAPAWGDVEDPDWWDLTMSVYAAMIDRMDQGIGRVLDRIRALGKQENTLVLFLSDNGACAQSIHNTPDVPPGPVHSYHTCDPAWANVSNTPFRLFKTFDHEGGISTPMIASWPRVIRNRGVVNRSVGHVIDFMPTFVELAGAEYPERCNNRDVLPAEGVSFAPALRDPSWQAGERSLFWELRGAWAARQGKWKIVKQGPERTHIGMQVPKGCDAWELYDVEADRCELRNLAAQHPDKVRELAREFGNWRQRCCRTGAE